MDHRYWMNEYLDELSKNAKISNERHAHYAFFDFRSLIGFYLVAVAMVIAIISI